MEHPGPLIKGSIDLLVVVVVSQTCLLRECISQALSADGEIEVLLACATAGAAARAVGEHRPHLVLLDARFPDGPTVAGLLRDAAPDTGVIVIATGETPDSRAAWAGVGLVGAIPESASAAELPRLVREIVGSRRPCQAPAAGPFPRRVPQFSPDLGLGVSDEQLTPRERLIGTFIGAGLSNKEIAGKLDISIGTAKAHVHNLLGKLNLSSRAQVAARLHRSFLRS